MISSEDLARLAQNLANNTGRETGVDAVCIILVKDDNVVAAVVNPGLPYDNFVGAIVEALGQLRPQFKGGNQN